MSGTSSTTVVTMGEVGGGVGGGCYFRPTFTAVQWQELEHQAMIYKYLLAGLPVPPELVACIRRRFEAIPSRFFSHPSLTYCSYYGKKFDPEPGRCRRTDGKKWRCSKDAYPDSKYCERHMHRGRNRSRKPVESHSASQSLSAAMPHNVTGSSSSSVMFQSSGSGSGIYQNIPFYSAGKSEDLCSGRSVTKFRIDPGSCGDDSREYRYTGLAPDAVPEVFSPEASGSIGILGVGTIAGQSSELHMCHVFDRMAEVAMSKHQQQHCVFDNEIVSSEPVKQKQHSARPFFDEWPSIKESWSNLDDGSSEKNSISKTPLSISTPVAYYSEFD